MARLEYEAYEPMADKELRKLCEDMFCKWELVRTAIIHRIGCGVLLSLSPTKSSTFVQHIVYMWCCLYPTYLCSMLYARCVPVGEASVIVAVSSAHRRDSLAAVEYGIDTLKAKVPIWKKASIHTHYTCIFLYVFMYKYTQIVLIYSHAHAPPPFTTPRARISHTGAVQRRHLKLEGKL